MLRRQTLSQHISVFELNDSCFRFRFGYNWTKRTHIYTRITNTAEKPVDISRFSSVYMIQTRKKNFRFHGTWTTRAIDRAISPSSVPKQRIYQTKFGNEHTDPSAYRLHTYTHTVQYMCKISFWLIWTIITNSLSLDRPTTTQIARGYCTMTDRHDNNITQKSKTICVWSIPD